MGRQVGSRARGLIAAGVWSALALALYEPLAPRPFAALDFSELLGLLTRSHGVLDAWLALCRYYAAQGRFNVLPLLGIALKWQWFHWNVAGWYALRCLQLGLLALATHRLARRFGADRVGASAGAALFLVAGPAVSVWQRLTVAEPFGLLVLFAGVEVALHYRLARRRARSLAALALLAVAVVLSKEALAIFLPLLALLTATGSPPLDADPTPPASSAHGPASWWLPTLALGAGACLAMVPVALVAANAPRSALIASYGHGSLSLAHAWDIAVMSLLPARNAAGLPHPLHPANLAFGAVVVTGWALALTRSRGRARRALLVQLGAIAYALLATLAFYLPWPSFGDYYALPALIASALSLATALTALGRHVHWLARGAVALLACAFALCAADAYKAARLVRAEERVVFELAGALAGLHGYEGGVMATNTHSPQAWQGMGPTLSRYSSALAGRPVLELLDLPCATAAQRFMSARPRLVLVSFAADCGLLPHPAYSAKQRFASFDWRSLTVRTVASRADLYAVPR